MPRDLDSIAPPRLQAVPPISSARPYVWRAPETIQRRQWVYGSQLLRGSLSVVVAPGATGKTAMLVGSALALATGRDLLGVPVWGGAKRCWLWNLEDSAEEMSRQIQAAALHWEIEEADIGGRLYLNTALDGDTLKVAKEDREGVTIFRPVLDALVAELQDRSIDVLVVDPFVSSHDVNENSNGAIDAVAKEWAMVAVRANCSVVLVHHVSKAGSAEVTANSARGAVALTAAARSVMALNRMSDEEASRFGIEGEGRRRYFRAFDDKNNRAPPADKSDWFELVSVRLGNGPNGGDSLPVVVPWSPPSTFDGVSVDDLLQVQRRIDVGEWRKSDQCPEWAGHAIAAVLNIDADRPAGKRRIKALMATWLANGALREEERDDKGRRKRPFIVVGNWADA